jgi:hypothetical protein
VLKEYLAVIEKRFVVAIGLQLETMKPMVNSVAPSVAAALAEDVLAEKPKG